MVAAQLGATSSDHASLTQVSPDEFSSLAQVATVPEEKSAAEVAFAEGPYAKDMPSDKVLGWIDGLKEALRDVGEEFVPREYHGKSADNVKLHEYIDLVKDASTKVCKERESGEDFAGNADFYTVNASCTDAATCAAFGQKVTGVVKHGLEKFTANLGDHHIFHINAGGRGEVSGHLYDYFKDHTDLEFYSNRANGQILVRIPAPSAAPTCHQ